MKNSTTNQEQTITLRNPLAMYATDGSEGVTISTVFDTAVPILIVPESVSELLELPFVRQQALHEAAKNNNGKRKPVLAVELELNGTRAIFEAVVEPNISSVIVNPSLLRSLETERKN